MVKCRIHKNRTGYQSAKTTLLNGISLGSCDDKRITTVLFVELVTKMSTLGEHSPNQEFRLNFPTFPVGNGTVTEAEIYQFVEFVWRRVKLKRYGHSLGKLPGKPQKKDNGTEILSNKFVPPDNAVPFAIGNYRKIKREFKIERTAPSLVFRNFRELWLNEMKAQERRRL